MTGEEEKLHRRVEDASLNASAPPQQLWLDGWLVRLSPGKARRARSINAVATGVRPMEEKLRECEGRYRAAGLPMFVRITPFSQPTGLDDMLAQRGWHRIDETLVMVLPALDAVEAPSLPAGIDAAAAGPAEYARAVGILRESSPEQVNAHAQHIALSPVPYSGLVWRRDGEVVACGQIAPEGDLVGLYDVFTAPAARGAGLARALCASLLVHSRGQGARAAYLQVDGANNPARAVYRRLGFADAYRYHYRCAVADAH